MKEGYIYARLLLLHPVIPIIRQDNTYTTEGLVVDHHALAFCDANQPPPH